MICQFKAGPGSLVTGCPGLQLVSKPNKHTWNKGQEAHITWCPGSDCGSTVFISALVLLSEVICSCEVTVPQRLSCHGESCREEPSDAAGRLTPPQHPRAEHYKSRQT